MTGMGDDGSEERPLETGWLADTPVEDSLLRRFLFNQGAVNQTVAAALGGRVERTADAILSDSGTAIAYFNQAILTHPIIDADDDAVIEVERFYDGINRPATLLSLWPTPDLGARGWSLVGHPMMVARGAFPHHHEPAPGVAVEVASDPGDLATAERIAVEGYPLPEAAGFPPGSLFPPALADEGLVVRVGRLDGEPAGVGLCYVDSGLVNLCLGATMPIARRRGVWEALVWTRVAEAPELPSVAYTSDYSRPGFERMGFLPITRFTMWVR
jgi:hypothetical protein